MAFDDSIGQIIQQGINYWLSEYNKAILEMVQGQSSEDLLRVITRVMQG